MLPLAGGVGQPDMLLEEEWVGRSGDTRLGLPLMEWKCHRSAHVFVCACAWMTGCAFETK